MDNVAGYAGATVSAATYSSLDRVRFALGTRKEDAVHAYLAALDNPIPPVRVDSGPVQDVVIGPEDVDLDRLPLVMHSERDSGWYLTGGVQVVREPGGTIQHLGIHRMMRFGRRELGFWGGK